MIPRQGAHLCCSKDTISPHDIASCSTWGRMKLRLKVIGALICGMRCFWENFRLIGSSRKLEWHANFFCLLRSGQQKYVSERNTITEISRTIFSGRYRKVYALAYQKKTQDSWRADSSQKDTKVKIENFVKEDTCCLLNKVRNFWVWCNILLWCFREVHFVLVSTLSPTLKNDIFKSRATCQTLAAHIEKFNLQIFRYAFELIRDKLFLLSIRSSNFHGTLFQVTPCLFLPKHMFAGKKVPIRAELFSWYFMILLLI